MNHELGYRQGMNEIVAVIIYYGLTEEETIDSLSSKEHIEPDSYYIFDKIMDLGLDQLYTSNEYFRLKDDVFLEIPNLDRSGEEEISTSIRKCHYIFHKILASADFELYQHISRHKFEPQLFLLRWLRCMLSREFGIDEICYVWDVIFGFSGGNNLEILNYICTAMLVKSRETCKEYVVLKNFHSDLLQLLMKPMTISNIKELIEEAVKFQYNKIETKLYKVQAVKSQNNILNKIVNLFTENISSSHISMQVQNVITPLDEAFDYVIQAIQITEKAKNS